MKEFWVTGTDFPKSLIWHTAFISSTTWNYIYCASTLKRSVGTDDSSSSSFTFFRISCQSASLFKDLMAWIKRKENSEWNHLPSFPLKHIAIKLMVWFVRLWLLYSSFQNLCKYPPSWKRKCSLTFGCVTKGTKVKQHYIIHMLPRLALLRKMRSHQHQEKLLEKWITSKTNPSWTTLACFMLKQAESATDVPQVRPSYVSYISSICSCRLYTSLIQEERPGPVLSCTKDPSECIKAFSQT